MSLSGLISRLTMGCVCGHEVVNVDGRNFFIKSRLGEGGFSYVDLAEDKQNRRLFALKRITCHSKEDEKVAIQEVQYMNQFSHDNLIPCEAHALRPIKNHMTAISEVIIAMPYYGKGSIHDELEFLRRRSDFMPESKIVHLFRGVCEGLKVLHNASPTPLAHRDVKPHNVMLKNDDTPVLMDFGSMGPARMEVKTISEATAMTDLAAERCSMPYRAPELFNVQTHTTLDERVDIWSLGCTLYAMCFYESPFDKVHQRGDSIALAVQSGNIRLPENSRYSSGLRSMISSMLVVNAAERPMIDTIITQTEALLQKLENRV